MASALRKSLLLMTVSFFSNQWKKLVDWQYQSGQQGPRCRYCRDSLCAITEMSSLNSENRSTLPVNSMSTQPVLWRNILSSTAGTGTNLVMSNMQQLSTLWFTRCWRVSYLFPATKHWLTNFRYVKNILKNTSSSVDQVTIQPDWKWELHTRKEPTNASQSNAAGSDSDDDLIEITKEGSSIRMSAPRSNNTPSSVPPRLSGTPASLLAQPSDPNSGSSKSGKRPASAVIDLTSSGDEDDEPLAKRPMNGYGVKAISMNGSFSRTYPDPTRPV